MSFRNVLLWPIFVIGCLFVYGIYSLFRPCQDGFFIGSCAFGQLVFYTILIFSFVFYGLLSYIVIRLRGEKKTVAWLFFLLGIGSVVGIVVLMIAVIPFGIFVIAFSVEGVGQAYVFIEELARKVISGRL